MANSKDLDDLLNAPPTHDRIDPPVTTRLQTLPFSELSWENFERLCTRIIATDQDIQDCHRHGGQGDYQAGIDILAHRLKPNGAIERWAYQCKRWKRMTPGDLHRIAGELEFPADHYVILYSSIRIFVEHFRADRLTYLGSFSAAQSMGFIGIIVGFCLMFAINKKRHRAT